MHSLNQGICVGVKNMGFETAKFSLVVEPKAMYEDNYHKITILYSPKIEVFDAELGVFNLDEPVYFGDVVSINWCLWFLRG